MKNTTCNQSKKCRRRSRYRASNPNGAGLIYSELEKRQLLTTFVVNTTLDTNAPADGLVSLREAITAANSNAAFGDAPAGKATGDRIWFDPAMAGSTITLAGNELVITDDLFIQGGPNDITIAGNGSTRMFANVSSERSNFGNSIRCSSR